MPVKIYHNPRCSKSRATLDLLEARGVDPEIVEYLKTPPSAAEISRILAGLGLEPRGLMRRKETVYRELGLDAGDLGRDALIEAMAAHPVLIERPVVENAGRFALGRPPENVLGIL